MWFYLIIGGIVVFSLVIILAIVLKRFPQLALIDVDSLPQERESQKKKQILSGRIGRRFGKVLSWLRVKLAPLSNFLSRQFERAHEAVVRLDRKFWGRKTATIHPNERRELAEKMSNEAKSLMDQGKVAESEKKYIDAISMDERYWDAYRGLGELYMEAKKYAQAKETYEFLARKSLRECCPNGENGNHEPSSTSVQAEVAHDHLNLAAACRFLGDIAGWRQALEVAVSHEPTNPRHLDLLLEACIMDGDQNKASEVLELLETVNPENQKLSQLKKQVEEMK